MGEGTNDGNGMQRGAHPPAVRPVTRRGFLSVAVLAGASLRVEATQAQSGESGARGVAGFPFSTNEYPWLTFYEREGREWDASRNACVREVRLSGFQAMEPTVDSPEQPSRIATTTREERIALPSMYVGSVLHDPARSEVEMARVIAIAKVARAAGTRIIVTNPSPIRWGADEYKSDQQLELQPRNLQLYGRWIRELHLRQSRQGVWTERFETGDIDFSRLATELAGIGVAPHVVMEQAVEAATPHTLGAVDAHKASFAHAKKLFPHLDH